MTLNGYFSPPVFFPSLSLLFKEIALLSWSLGSFVAGLEQKQLRERSGFVSQKPES